MNVEPDSATRLYSLDALRGLAALLVVVFHYSNFFTVGNILPPSFQKANLPFYPFLSGIYAVGWLAVDLFFTLSGFVFFWLYAKKIAERRITAKHFWLLRFSRLYPLHLITLAMVAYGQWLFAQGAGSFFVFPTNDLKHFMMHLGFISAWGGNMTSFNGPVWSVSIEVAVYAVFFLFCRYFPLKIIMLLTISIMGLWMVFRFHNFMGRGIGSFFIGGAVQLLYQRTFRFAKTPLCAFFLGSALFGIWFFWGFVIHINWSFLPSYLQQRAARYFPITILFPLTILILAYVEPYMGMLMKRLAILGDISYSLYLLHFPLQLGIVIVLQLADVSLNVMYSPIAFLLFFASLIPLSLLSFFYYEKPSQSWLRSQ